MSTGEQPAAPTSPETVEPSTGQRMLTAMNPCSCCRWPAATQWASNSSCSSV